MNKLIKSVMLALGIMFGFMSQAQAYVLATLPGEITTLVTDANDLRDDVITSKVVIVGAIIGFAFVLWLIRRR